MTDTDNARCYQHVLIATDLTETAQTTVARGQKIALACGAQLSLAHIIEPLTFSYGVDLSASYSSLQQDMHQWASEELDKLGQSHGIEPACRHLIGGRATLAVHELADRLAADLIVIGSHMRQPLSPPFGSTANGILHHAKCDVLTVRLDPR